MRPPAGALPVSGQNARRTELIDSVDAVAAAAFGYIQRVVRVVKPRKLVSLPGLSPENAK